MARYEYKELYEEDPIWLVYRVYTAKEKVNPTDRVEYYGWSYKKSIVKAFMLQRDKKKYKIVRFKDADMKRLDWFPQLDDLDQMVESVELTFASTGKKIQFYTTMAELEIAETRIQRYYHLLPSIPDKDLLNMFWNLDPYYRSALEFIGFRPYEIDSIVMQLTGEVYNTLYTALSEVTNSYNGFGWGPFDDEVRFNGVPGLRNITNPSDKILYSMENFIKVLKDDL